MSLFSMNTLCVVIGHTQMAMRIVIDSDEKKDQISLTERTGIDEC